MPHGQSVLALSGPNRIAQGKGASDGGHARPSPWVTGQIVITPSPPHRVQRLESLRGAGERGQGSGGAG